VENVPPGGEIWRVRQRAMKYNTAACKWPIQYVCSSNVLLHWFCACQRLAFILKKIL